MPTGSPSPSSPTPLASQLPSLRLSAANARPHRPGGDYVLYWMVANRRLSHNFALDRALEAALALGRPLLIFEPLRAGYRWASLRHHAFVVDGMAEHAADLADSPVGYLPYVEPEPGAGQGLLARLAQPAALVVTDSYPCFFLPRMLAKAASSLDVRLEAMDSNGLLPLRATEREFPSAHTFRRFLQKELRPHLEQLPDPTPLAQRSAVTRLPAFAGLKAEIHKRFPSALDSAALLGKAAAPKRTSRSQPTTDANQRRLVALQQLPIDQKVQPFGPLAGGSQAARSRLLHFLKTGLPRYAERNDPSVEVASGLSPYLHFGHIGVHEVFASLAKDQRWTTAKLVNPVTGSREGWWGLPAQVEGFLDELITWREVGFNCCHLRADFDAFESLPDFAQKTLKAHQRDRRPTLYSDEQLETSQTHDQLWNAAQNQLVSEGRMHNYLRMLWGKKVLEWSASPQDALETLIHLNNKYALDGRDPNSYTGIFWVFGRYDRPWGPERPIFGSVRYMSSDNTAKKLDVKGYLQRYAPQAQGELF